MFADVLLSGVFALTLGAIAQSHGRRMPWLGMALQLALPPLAPWCSRPPRSAVAPPGAVGFARALCDDVVRTPCMHDGATIRCAISLGVCSGTPRAEDRWNAWTRATDCALYAATGGGRSASQANTGNTGSLRRNAPHRAPPYTARTLPISRGVTAQEFKNATLGIQGRLA